MTAPGWWRCLLHMANEAEEAAGGVVQLDEADIASLRRAAGELAQAKLQKDSAIAVSRKLQDEREKLLARVEAALLGIQSVQSKDADEKDPGTG